MAPTSFSKSSGASLAVPLLLAVVVLAGGFATVTHAQVFNLKVVNNLDDGPAANDADCTITSPNGGPAETFFVPAQGSNTVTLQATQSLTSIFKVEVYGKGPLGMGCRGCCFLGFGCRGKTYSTSGDIFQRAVSLAGYTVKITGNCGTNSNPALQLDGYATSQETAEIATTCAQLD